MRRGSFLKLLFVAPVAAAVRPLLQQPKPAHFDHRTLTITREMIEDDIYGMSPIQGRHYDMIALDDLYDRRLQKNALHAARYGMDQQQFMRIIKNS